MNVTKKEFLSAIKDGRIAITGDKYTSNGWTGYRVWIIPKRKDKLFGYNLKNVVVETAAYWNKKNRNYSCVAWGTSRPLDVYLSIGDALGLKFEEEKQNYQMLI